MAEDASGPNPDEGDGDDHADPVDDARGFESGATDLDPNADPDERRFRNDDRDRADEPTAGTERIPIDLGGREDASSVDEPHEDDEEEYVGPEPGSAPIHPEEVTLENVLFVLLGAVSMVLVLVRLFSLGLG